MDPQDGEETPPRSESEPTTGDGPCGAPDAPGPEEAVKAGRAGIAAALLRAGREELIYPRARVRAALRRAVHRVRGFAFAAMACLGALVGATFVVYAADAGLGRGLAAWAVFVGSAAALSVGGPLVLVYAWPAAVAAPLAACIWVVVVLGAGALWICVASVALALALYLTAAESAALGGAAALAWAVWGYGAAPAAVAFVAGAGVLVAFRRWVATAIIAAAWVAASCVAAGYAVSAALGEAFPAEWYSRPVPGPWGLGLCVAAAAAYASMLVRARGGRSPGEAAPDAQSDDDPAERREAERERWPG